jgi:hypothetical protein
MGEVIMGRPTVINETAVRKLERAFKDGLSVSEACFVSGIGRTTYYEHKASDEDFANKMELAKAYITIKAKKAVVHAIDGGNVPAARWWLEHKARNEFGLHPVDEDTEWNKQAEVDDKDDAMLQILEGMRELAEEGRLYESSPQPATLKNIATKSTTLEPDETTVVQTQDQPIEPVITQTTISPDSVFADLNYED